MSTTNVYVLRLEGGKYYVGKSEDVQKRYSQHLKGGGSAWTRKHSPISVLKTYTNVSHFEEDKVTKELMAKYGIDKVRGGSYSEVVLDKAQLQNLEREIRGAKDLCNRCGKSGHFANRCDEEEDEDDVDDDEDEEDEDDEDDEDDDDDDDEDDEDEDEDDEDEDDDDDDDDDDEEDGDVVDKDD